MPRKEIEVKVIRRLNQDTRFVCVSIQIRRQTHKQKVVPWTEDELEKYSKHRQNSDDQVRWKRKEKNRWDSKHLNRSLVMQKTNSNSIILFVNTDLMAANKNRREFNSLRDVRHTRACVHQQNYSLNHLKIPGNSSQRNDSTMSNIVLHRWFLGSAAIII